MCNRCNLRKINHKTFSSVWGREGVVLCYRLSRIMKHTCGANGFRLGWQSFLKVFFVVTYLKFLRPFLGARKNLARGDPSLRRACMLPAFRDLRQRHEQGSWKNSSEDEKTVAESIRVIVITVTVTDKRILR